MFRTATAPIFWFHMLMEIQEYLSTNPTYALGHRSTVENEVGNKDHAMMADI